jgi:hypothetical protein
VMATSVACGVPRGPACGYDGYLAVADEVDELVPIHSITLPQQPTRATQEASEETRGGGCETDHSLRSPATIAECAAVRNIIC